MREFERKCVVRAACPSVWRYLADYRNIVSLTSSGRAVLEHGEPGAIGVTYSAVMEWEGVPSMFRAVLKEAVPYESLMWAGRTPGARSVLRLKLVPIDEGSTGVTASVTLAMGKGTMPLEPFGGAILERMLERMMRSLHAWQPGALPESEPTAM